MLSVGARTDDEQDMGLAANSATLAATPMPLGETALRMYDEVVEKRPDLARKDFSSVYEYLAKHSRGKR